MTKFISIFCCWVLITVASAQQSPVDEISLLGKLEDKLISWFDDLSKSADKIADKEDQKKLKASLTKLQASLFDVESNGRTLVEIIETKPLNKDAAKKTIGDTRTALSNLKTILHGTGLLLRNQYRSGGADAEDMIANAIERRGLLLSNLSREVESGHTSDETIHEAKSILISQRDASIAVGQVIEKLPQ